METKVVVDRDTVLKAWKLMSTREWPLEYMEALLEVQVKFTQAVEEADNEDKGSDED